MGPSESIVPGTVATWGPKRPNTGPGGRSSGRMGEGSAMHYRLKRRMKKGLEGRRGGGDDSRWEGRGGEKGEGIDWGRGDRLNL